MWLSSAELKRIKRYKANIQCEISMSLKTFTWSLFHFILIVTLLYYIKLIMCVSAVNVQISTILSDEERFSFLNEWLK